MVQCSWHGSQFDVQSGAVKADPADWPISTCRVEESDDDARLRAVNRSGVIRAGGSRVIGCVG